MAESKVTSVSANTATKKETKLEMVKVECKVDKEKKLWIVYEKPTNGPLKVLATCNSLYAAQRSLNSKVKDRQTQLTQTSKLQRKANVTNQAGMDVWEETCIETKSRTIPGGFFKSSRVETKSVTTVLTEYGISTMFGITNGDGVGDRCPLMEEEYVAFVKDSFTNFAAITATITGYTRDANRRGKFLGVTGALKKFRDLLYRGESIEYLDKDLLINLTNWLMDLMDASPMPSTQDVDSISGAQLKPFLALEIASYLYFLMEFSAFRSPNNLKWIDAYYLLDTCLGMRIDTSFLDAWKHRNDLKKEAKNRVFGTEERVEFPETKSVKPTLKITIGSAYSIMAQKMIDDEETAVYARYLQETGTIHPLPKTPFNLLKIIYAEKRIETLPHVLMAVAIRQLERFNVQTGADRDLFLLWIRELTASSSRSDVLTLLGCYYKIVGMMRISKLFFRVAASRGDQFALYNLCVLDPNNKQWFLDFAYSDYQFREGMT